MPKRMSWEAIGRALGLTSGREEVEVSDDAPLKDLESNSTPLMELVESGPRPDPEADRLRGELMAARLREEARIKRDGESFAGLMVRDEKIPPYLGNVVALTYEAMGLADLARPLEAAAIMVGETPCLTRVEALTEHYRQLAPAGHSRRQVLDRARVVSNGSEGEPSLEDLAREQGRAAARSFNKPSR